jgi:leader peptidase (prepilin peptidase)/N-methyltransferase
MMSSLPLRPPQAAFALALGGALAAATLAWGPSDMPLVGVVLAFALAWASVVDIDRFILPDLITLGLVLAGLGVALMLGPEALLHRAIGAVAGYGVLAGLALWYRRVRKREGLGLGDAKLLAAAGAWLGWAALPAVLLLASLSALVLFGLWSLRAGRIDASTPLPFGPFIAAGFWLAWVFPDLPVLAAGAHAGPS